MSPAQGPGSLAALVEGVHRALVDQAGSEVAHRSTAQALVRRVAPALPADQVELVADRVLARVGGMGPLEELLADAAVSEVMVNSGGAVWVERSGRLARTDIVLAEPDINLLIERIVAPLGLRADRTAPLIDARLADGSRVNAVVRPLAVDGPCLTIRRFRGRVVQLEDFTSPAVAELLRWAVKSRANMVIAGGAGVGKTTLLSALTAELPDGERIITIEDTAELQVRGDHVIRLEARPGNSDGVGAVTVRDLVRNALRMRPDRLVVGEVRGPEALDLLQALNTGHEGSLSTCHANGPDDVLRRLETMALMAGVGVSLAAVREQLGAALDLVVQISRTASGRRVIRSVSEVRPVVAELGANPAAPFGSRTRMVAEGPRVCALPERSRRSDDADPPDPRWLDQ